MSIDEHIVKHAITFLTEVERNKEWIKDETKNYSMYTCGYTGPGITIVILCFEFLGFDKYWTTINSYPPAEKQFIINGINEAIGNLFDLAPICPLSGCPRGIRGLITSKPRIGEPIKWHTTNARLSIKDLLPGPNLISFTTPRGSNSTFHHSVVYVPYYPTGDDRCYIIDSWIEDNDTCRPISKREFKLTEIVGVLNRLNGFDVPHAWSESSDIISLLQHYFLAPSKGKQYDFIREHKISVYLINREAINAIMNVSFQHVQHSQSNFGGKHKKHRKIYSKRHSHTKLPPSVSLKNHSIPPLILRSDPVQKSNNKSKKHKRNKSFKNKHFSRKTT